MKLCVRHLHTRFPAIVLGGLLVVPGAFAQAMSALPDPTRPPAGFVDQLPSGMAGARPATLPDVPRPGDAVDGEAAGGLQSVLIPRHGKPVAIIGGKYVPLGERYGAYELVSVSESEVVLARGKERKVLKLTPRAEKKFGATLVGDKKKVQGRPIRLGAAMKESETKQ